jgi:RimJ/RimL family protein N-acetyltransferase
VCVRRRRTGRVCETTATTVTPPQHRLTNTPVQRRVTHTPVRGLAMTRDVVLRDIIEADLPTLFEHQRDPEAARMAGFVSREHDAFMEHWAKILRDDTILKKSILYEGQLVGNVVCFEQFGRKLVGYWIGKEYWGRRIATRALFEFLQQVATRPLYAHVAKHNAASLRVLEKCGFVLCGRDLGLGGTAPGTEDPDEFVLKLERAPHRPAAAFDATAE